MKKITCLFLLISLNFYAQCFDCNKNIGGHTSEVSAEIEKLPDGMLHLVNSDNTSGCINKYDFDCNLLWSKTFGSGDVYLHSATSDAAGNIYLLIQNTTSINAGMGPWNIDGFMMSPGLNFYKLNPQGDITWSRHIGPAIGYTINNIELAQNTLYITGTFYSNLTIGGTVSFNHPYTNHPRAFIAKYDIGGNFIDATEYGNGVDDFSVSEIDPQGNTYLTYSHPNWHYSKLVKIDSDLNISWTVTLSEGANSTTGLYFPNALRFNTENQKLYVWGSMNLNTNILGHQFFISTINGILQTALTEFDVATGTMTNIRRLDNNSRSYSSSSVYGGDLARRAFMKEKDGYLYILTSFYESMTFPNGTVNTPPYQDGDYFSEELVLFKVLLADFTEELIFQSHGVENLYYAIDDHPGPIAFNGDDLYLTATFSSKPLSINGSIIQNNSGNGDTDAMLYKFNILSLPGSGTIVTEDTCLNDQTGFSIAGNFDSIVWDFGEPSSANNTANGGSTFHQYAAIGTYHVSALVTCGAATQTVTKEVVITQTPYLNAVATITACEDTFGSGIASTFDTTNLKTQLIGLQPGVTLEYFTADGVKLAGPLPNPFTNTTPGSQTLLVRAYFQQNKTCFTERSITFSTLPTVEIPTVASPQNFCAPQAPTLSDVTISGSNITWYDAATGGNVLPVTTLLQNVTTYFATQSNGTCESTRVSVLVNVYDTVSPTGSAVQSFCSSQNPAISDIAITGSDVRWYTTASGTSQIADTTLLTDGTTYYASQTLNNCESTTRTAVTVSVISSLNANDYQLTICDITNDGREAIDLLQFNPLLISTTANHSFEYYLSQSDAEDEVHNIPGQFTLSIAQQTVFVRITSATGCFQIVQLSLTLSTVPELNSETIVPICENGVATLDAGGDFDSYNWSNGGTSRTINVSQVGSYSVTAGIIYNSQTTCTSQQHFTVVHSAKPVITSIDTKEWTDTENTITVSVAVPGSYEYSLDGITYQDINIFTNLPAGRYDVHVKNGCGFARQQVLLMMFPKFFTPNGDGVNDSWSVKFSLFEPDIVVTIFDRYGTLVYQMPYNGSWNGESNGRALPATDYWFVIKRRNGMEYQGHFSLRR